MKLLGVGLLVGTAPWQFKDSETGQNLSGNSALFIEPGSVDSLRLTLPDNVNPASLELMCEYQLEVEIRRTGAASSVKLVRLEKVTAQGELRPVKAAAAS